MKNKIKVLIGVVILILSITNANAENKAGALNLIKKHPFLSAGVLAGSAVYMQTTMHKARHLSYHLPEVEPYFNKNPQDYKSVAEYVFKALLKPANKNDYDRYKKLAERMGLEGIPPYSPPPVNNNNILDNPIQEGNPNDNILENPIQEEQFSNIITTPQGEKYDTSTEFPNQPISTWEDYIYAKKQSDILAESMEAAGMGKRPKGYASHHIVAWDDTRYPVCQDLRDLINNNGILLNDAENGVYLPTRKVTKNPNEAYHPEIHTNNYYQNVYNRLSFYDGDTQGMKNELIKIGSELKNNQFKY